MTLTHRLAAGGIIFVASITGTTSGLALTAKNELASHIAVYDLKLASSRGKSAIAARGRILYDFSGSICTGYKLEFRQVSELNNGEGKDTLSDLRSNTWEDATAQNYTFSSQNYLNENLVDDVNGSAKRENNAIDVRLSKPKNLKFSLGNGIVFPTEHIRRILDAAHAGTNILQFPVYDGSEGGQKVYNTLTVIGHTILPDQKMPTDAAAGQAVLAGMNRWPVTVSYFDRKAKRGEQIPVYTISFELYENGISRALLLDYNDFAISGKLSMLSIKKTKPCP